MSRSIFLSLAITTLLATFATSGCATYKVSHVTDHEGRLYLTTDKKTTLFYLVVLSSEQAIAACKEKRGNLECTELEVSIDGSDWAQ